jgi:hypothetical protein
MRSHYNIKCSSFFPLNYHDYSAQSPGTVTHLSDLVRCYINEEVEIAVHEWLKCKNLICTMVEFLGLYQNEIYALVVWVL